MFGDIINAVDDDFILFEEWFDFILLLTVLLKKMIGGFHQQDVSAEHQNLVNSQKDHINSRLGANHNSYTVNQVWTQVVAGTNYFFHLTADDNSQVSVCVF